jgi:hypothetical protein
MIHNKRDAMIMAFGVLRVESYIHRRETEKIYVFGAIPVRSWRALFLTLERPA